MSISPNVPSPQESYNYEGTTGTPRWIAVVFIVLFLGLAGLGYAGYSAQSRLETSLAKAQDQNKLLTAQLDQANARLADLKGHIDVTKGRLERANGDMGVMSGLIAHNRDDLEELKRRGDRNYYEFKITKSKSAQKVGPVQITLNKTDLKKSKYTVTVFVDDRSIEKKDKTAGEPVQFYVRGGSRMPPYEFVVFEVGKNQITGYLSTPKDTGAPAATPAAAASKPS